MINTPIESEPEPEPDIPRFSSSSLSHQPSPATHNHSTNPHLDTAQHGLPDTRIDPRPAPAAHGGGGEEGVDEKRGFQVNLAPPTTVTSATIAAGPDVPISRPSSNRPKVRDFAQVAQTATVRIAQPILRATEKLVPAKREGVPSDLVIDPPRTTSAPLHAKKRLPNPSFLQSLKNTIKAQPLLFAIPILCPVAWAMHITDQDPVAVFVVSLVAVIPLAGGLGFATEELAHRLGDAWGGLLNATFGNVIELLIAIIALTKGDIDIVQASMVGSILSNVLLVLGMSYFAGGLRFHEQLYGVVGAQMHISLLGITLTAIVLPAAYHYAYPNTSNIVDQTIRPGSQTPTGPELDNLLKMSRGLSFILLAVYGMFLCFQLYTHAYLFRIPREPSSHPLPGPQPHHQRVFPRPNWVPSIVDSSSGSSNSSVSGSGPSPFRRFRRWSTKTTLRSRSNSDAMDQGPFSPQISREPGHMDEEAVIGTPGLRSHDPAIDIPDCEHANPLETRLDDNDDEEYIPPVKISFWFAMGMLAVMAGLAGYTAECLVSSIDGLTETSGVSREFVGLILLPVIGNAVEHITAVTVSVKDKLNLSMSIAVGSSIQISLCILPILVLIGWAIGQPMMLFFDTFETITLVISVLLVNFAISDGRTNYLEGFVMMMAWVSIALVCWFYDPVN